MTPHIFSVLFVSHFIYFIYLFFVISFSSHVSFFNKFGSTTAWLCSIPVPGRFVLVLLSFRLLLFGFGLILVSSWITFPAGCQHIVKPPHASVTVSFFELATVEEVLKTWQNWLGIKLFSSPALNATLKSSLLLLLRLQKIRIFPFFVYCFADNLNWFPAVDQISLKKKKTLHLSDSQRIKMAELFRFLFYLNCPTFHQSQSTFVESWC